MGTHPIFESDFDCLTDMNRLLSRRTLTCSKVLLARGSGGIRPKVTPQKIEEKPVEKVEEKKFFDKMQDKLDQDKKECLEREKMYEEHMKTDEYKERLSIIDNQGFQVMAGLFVCLALLQICTSHYKNEI